MGSLEEQNLLQFLLLMKIHLRFGTEPSDAKNTDKYGWKVNGYNVTTDEFTTGVWRLFYQDNNYTYLITDECSGIIQSSILTSTDACLKDGSVCSNGVF